MSLPFGSVRSDAVFYCCWHTVDLLTMQSGKMISMQRVSMVCLDEADRAFDMGFEPQVKKCPCTP